MALDASTEMLLAAAAAAPTPAPGEVSIESVRQAMLAMAVMGEPAVAAVEEVEVDGPNGAVAVTLYRPVADPPGPAPVLVFFHGGGWVMGSRDHVDHLCRRLANESQRVVASVEYRLAPEHQFPAGLEDCFAATRWLADHGGELGLDPECIAVGGESAGANLAAAVCLLARDRGGPPIRQQLLLYPVTDADFSRPSMVEFGDGHLLTRDAMQWFWELYVGQAALAGGAIDPLAAPLRAPSLEALPPAMLITASHDPLRDEGEAYGRRLQEAGVPTTISRHETIHGFMTMASVVPAGAAGITEAAGFLRQARTQ